MIRLWGSIEIGYIEWCDQLVPHRTMLACDGLVLRIHFFPFRSSDEYYLFIVTSNHQKNDGGEGV